MRVSAWIPPRSLAVLLGAPSSASPSCASAALQPAYERDFASPRLAHSRPSLRRAIRLCDWSLADRPAAAERAAARTERIASASLACGQFVHVCARQRSSRACCARCAWSRASVPGARDARALRRARWCAACRTRRPCWRARSRDVRSLIGARGGRLGADGRDGGSGVPGGIPLTLGGCLPCLEYMLVQCLSA